MTPKSEKALAVAVKSAAAAGTALHIKGGGTRAGLGHAVTGEVISTSALKGISLYEPGALTIVAAAGTPLETIEKALAREGQRLAFEPMNHSALYGTNGKPTIGGVVACNASGPRRIQAGAVRDALIGVRFVNGEGTVIKNGGRVMKNVTGYDLVKLMCGSHGTLGILTEVAFKVLPVPEASALLTLPRLAADTAVAAMSAALTSPYDVTGAAAHLGKDAATLIRIEGFEGSVKYRAGKLKDLLSRFADVDESFDAKTNKAAWETVRDAKPIAAAKGDVWRISVRPSDGPAVVAALPQSARCLLDWGGGLVWACVPAQTDVRTALGAIGGHATLMRASEASKKKLGVFHPEPAPLATISTGLRNRFDPSGILNPGRMG